MSTDLNLGRRLGDGVLLGDEVEWGGRDLGWVCRKDTIGETLRSPETLAIGSGLAQTGVISVMQWRCLVVSCPNCSLIESEVVPAIRHPQISHCHNTFEG